jgi:hypothetical protein
MALQLIKVLSISILFPVIAISLQVTAYSSSVLAATESQEAGKKKNKVKLSQRRFYTLEPFTVPMMNDGAINEQFTIVIGIELGDEDDRSDIAHSVPRIRNEVYNELLHLVTFRRRGASIPQLAVLKSQLLSVTQRVMGEKIKALVIQQAFKGPTK